MAINGSLLDSTPPQANPRLPPVIEWVQLDSVAIPGEREPMRLMQRGHEFKICVGSIELMSNRECTSEAALATLTCTRLQDRPRAKILIGGLGMGFTLRAALTAMGPDARIVVAELVPAVVAWARGPLSHVFEGSLDDPRVEVREDDVKRVIQQVPADYDAILLDVDNGPEGLTRPENDRLYDVWGLKRARYALRPNGILAVWSGSPDRKFKARLQNTGFEVDEIRLRSNGTSGRRHVLWLATHAKGSSAPFAWPAAPGSARVEGNAQAGSRLGRSFAKAGMHSALTPSKRT
ncbi:spermidine synthase [Methylobacterium sp. WSM2598]|uniref:spermidine synthase n=1 Tax=Methylobacterium sp. WSM2598 TaxID=398261 RepID=UPI003FA53803